MTHTPCSTFDSVGDCPPSCSASTGVELVIVDSRCDRYGDFVEAAQASAIGLHFCTDGRSAVRLSRRFRADAWIIAAELPVMSGFDLLDMITPQVLQGDVDPLIAGARRSLDRVEEGSRTGLFIAADAYSLEDEQRALASGVAGYLVRPVTFDVIETAMKRAAGAGQPRYPLSSSRESSHPEPASALDPKTSAARSSS